MLSRHNIIANIWSDIWEKRERFQPQSFVTEHCLSQEPYRARLSQHNDQRELKIVFGKLDLSFRVTIYVICSSSLDVFESEMEPVNNYDGTTATDQECPQQTGTYGSSQQLGCGPLCTTHELCSS